MESTETTTVVRLSGPAELVCTIPRMVGFTPERSLVVVCLRGPRQRSGLTMRIDLPDPEHDGLLAEQLAARAEHAGADAVVAAVYTDEPGPLPRAELVAALQQAAQARGIEVVDALLVRRGRWTSYLCGDPSCCPDGGRAVAETPTGGAGLYAAEAAARGRAPFRDRAELAATVQPATGQRVRRLEHLATTAAAELAAEHRRDGAAAVAARVADELLADLARWLAGDRTLADGDAVRLVVGLADVPTRDRVLGWELPREDERELVALLSALCRCAPEGVGAAVSTVLAWWAYLGGDGALANVALDRALAEDADYNLARLLRQGLDGQVPPDRVRDVFR